MKKYILWSIALVLVVQAQAQNQRERRQNRAEIREGRMIIALDQEEYVLMEQRLAQWHALSTQGATAEWLQLREVLLDAMEEEVAQGYDKHSQARGEVRDSRREVRSERREIRHNRIDSRVSQDDRRDDRRDMRHDRRNLRDDRRDYRDDRRDEAAIWARTQEQARLLQVITQLSATGPGSPETQAQLLAATQAFVELMAADCRANERELREDKRERAEDRRERRDDRRERREY